MRLVGLTGGIGSGKSSVAALLSLWGATVVDADLVAREVVERGQPALAEIADRFGSQVLGPDGALDRAALAAIVFADEQARRDLEAITHPRIGDDVAGRIVAAREAEEADGHERVVVVDHPLLVESGAAASYPTVIVVTAPMDVRVQRLVEQRGMGEDDARARILAQADDAARAASATHIVDNSGDRADLERQVAEIARELGLQPVDA